MGLFIDFYAFFQPTGYFYMSKIPSKRTFTSTGGLERDFNSTASDLERLAYAAKTLESST